MHRTTPHRRAVARIAPALVALILVIQPPWGNVAGATSTIHPLHLTFRTHPSFASSLIPAPVQAAGTGSKGRNPLSMADAALNAPAGLDTLDPTATPAVRPTVTPTPMPGTLTTDLIVNGGFEAGLAPWQEQSAGNYPLISQASATNHPNSGNFDADFCNTQSCYDQLWQTVTVPALVYDATFSFWLMATPQASAGCNDSFKVLFRTTTGMLIDLLTTVCASNAPAPGAWTLETFPVAPILQQYEGQQIQVYFVGSTSASSDSSFYLDDVSMPVNAASQPTAVAVASETAAAGETATAGGTTSPAAGTTSTTGGTTATTGGATSGGTGGTAGPTNTVVPTPTPRPTLTPTPIPGTRATDLIVNGGFEAGRAPWQEQSAGDYELIDQAKPHSGTSSAAFCGGSAACNDQLWQTVTLPTKFDTLTLSFWLWIDTQHTSPACADTFTAVIRSTAGVSITPVAARCNSDATGDWIQVTTDLTGALQSFAGQPIQVYFQGLTTGANLTGFYLDDVSFLAETPIPPPTPTITATSTPTNTPVPTATPLPSVQILGVQLLRRPSGVITDTCDAVLSGGIPLKVTQLLFPNQTGILRVLYRSASPGPNPVVGQVVYELKGKPVDGDILLPAGKPQQPLLCTAVSFSGSGVRHFRAKVTVTVGQATSTAAITFYVGKCGHGVTGAHGQCVRCNTGYHLQKGKCQKIKPRAARKPPAVNRRPVRPTKPGRPATPAPTATPKPGKA